MLIGHLNIFGEMSILAHFFKSRNLSSSVLLMWPKQDADMLTGDEQVWKEVQESLKKIEELKAHWSILLSMD